MLIVSFLHQKDKHTMILSHVSGMRQSCQFWLWAPRWLWKNLLWWQGHLERYTVLFLRGWEASRQASVHPWDVPSTASVLLDKLFHSSPKTICSACCPDLEQGEEMGWTTSVVTQKWTEEGTVFYVRWLPSWDEGTVDVNSFNFLLYVVFWPRNYQRNGSNTQFH